MIAPRTGLAYWKRGPDDGRETFLREMSGLIGNMFVVGWASSAAVKALGNRMSFYNPHGIPAKAWISSTNLDAFQKIYTRALEKADSPQKARDHFVQWVLAGLESGDKKFSIESRLSALQKLEGHAQKQALAQMVQTVHGDDWDKHLGAYQALFQEGKVNALREKFLKDGWGRLSKTSQEALAEFYKRSERPKGSIRGAHNFDSRAVEQLSERHIIVKPDLGELKRDRDFIQARLDLSMDDLGRKTKLFEKTISQEALERGLTGTVHLRNLDHATQVATPFLSEQQNRGSLLKQVKFFLEQYVDRASHGATDISSDWKAQKAHIEDLLFKESKQGWKRFFLPIIEDGLVTATRKSKFMYTGVPMVFAILTAGALAFYNNYLTRMKHGGKVFFPGEGVPPETVPSKTPVPFSGAQPAQASALPLPVYRPISPAAPGYRQPFAGNPARLPQRGVIA